MDGVAFRAWWTLSTRLDRLYADGLIAQAVYTAACRFRADCERVGALSSRSVLARLGEPAPGSGDRHRDLFARVAAARRLRAVRARLGPQRYALVYWVTTEDLAWTELARRLGVSDGTARSRAAEAIKALVSLDNTPSYTRRG
jgi:DNA-directed RNA polymerase specialized sigma24 family protein